MKSVLIRVTLLAIIFGLTCNAWGIERKAEWEMYSRDASGRPVTAGSSSASPGKLDSDLQRTSYSIGMSIGQNLKSSGIEIDPEYVSRGIADMLGDKETSLTREESIEILAGLQEQVMARQEQMAAEQQAAFEKMAQKNLEDGQAFLAQNAKRDGVIVTESGLQYKILKPGSGAPPSAEDIVTVDYQGNFIDGTEFDSSYKRGEPVELSVNGIIPGWSEALLMMREGAKWRLFIPANLAYGPQGAPPTIEPNSTLVFEVELRSIAR